MELLEAEMDSAFDAARCAGWGNDMDEEPHVFILPAIDEFRFGFVWTSLDIERPVIVASPLPLPWLKG